MLLPGAGTRNIYSASTVDQMPKQIASALMFGTGTTCAVPDVDRTDYLLILGANPLASNGSLMTAPDMRGRLRALRARGGKLVVVDPRRTRTARGGRRAPLHPPRDRRAAAVRARPRSCSPRAWPTRAAAVGLVDGLDEVRALAAPFTPEAVAPVCGIDADEIRRMARELAAAPRAAVYGRIGTCTQEFGTLASWLVDVLNVLTGNLDREGGAMFPRAAAGHAQHRRHARARAAACASAASPAACAACREVFGELPVACLAEEIDTPGRGTGAGADHVSRQPGPLDPQQRPARRGAARARLHGQSSTSTSTRPRATPT